MQAKGTKRWYCPKCGVTVTTYIILKQPPIHKCGKSSTTKPLLERGTQ